MILLLVWGFFYKVLPSHAIEYTGYEIDPLLFEKAEENDNLSLHLGDYLRSYTHQHEAIVCNPPYARFQKMTNRKELFSFLKDNFGLTLKKNTSLASIFLAKSLHDLKVNGRLAYIMPFEFFNTGYGIEVKKMLIQDGTLKQIIVFENEKEIFNDVTTTVCILLCKKDGAKNKIKITKIKSIKEVESIDDISMYYQHELLPDALHYEQKWYPVIMSLYNGQTLHNNMVPLSFYGRFKRGIVTGVNDFFVLSMDKAKEFGIDKDYLVSCIAKSNQVNRLFFTDLDFLELELGCKNVFCFNGLGKFYLDAGAKKYIEYGESMNYHQKYLPKNKTPWFKIEKREPAVIWAGVFNRNRIKFIRNQTPVLHLNCFHGFYPNEKGTQYIDALFAYFISDFGQNTIKMNGRIYGNNLCKVEVNDLNNSLCPPIEVLERVDKESLVDFVEAAKEDKEKAIEIANRLFGGLMSDI